MLKALLVDLDGTLVNSALANATAYAQALAEHGVHIDPRALAAEIEGRAWRDFLPGLLATQPGTAPETIARRKRELYPGLTHLLTLNRPLATLLTLLQHRVPIALVTTASRAAVKTVLDHFALHPLFDLVIDGDSVAHAKPAPDAYHLAAQTLGADPKHCLVIEDSQTGLTAARAFGANILHWQPAPP